MNPKKMKPVLIISAVILALLFCGISMFRDQQEAQKPKTSIVTFDPSTLPDPPDSSIPKEMTIEFLEQSYHVYFESGPNRLGHISYRNENSYFEIQQGTEKILSFRQNNSLRGEDALPDEQLRALARQTAVLYTQNDLADYTVTDTCVFIPACLTIVGIRKKTATSPCGHMGRKTRKQW